MRKEIQHLKNKENMLEYSSIHENSNNKQIIELASNFVEQSIEILSGKVGENFPLLKSLKNVREQIALILKKTETTLDDIHNIIQTIITLREAIKLAIIIVPGIIVMLPILDTLTMLMC